MRFVAVMILFAVFMAACSPQNIVTEDLTYTGTNTVETGIEDQPDDTGTVSKPVMTAASIVRRSCSRLAGNRRQRIRPQVTRL